MSFNNVSAKSLRLYKKENKSSQLWKNAKLSNLQPFNKPIKKLPISKPSANSTIRSQNSKPCANVRFIKKQRLKSSLKRRLLLLSARRPARWQTKEGLLSAKPNSLISSQKIRLRILQINYEKNTFNKSKPHLKKIQTKKKTRLIQTSCSKKQLVMLRFSALRLLISKPDQTMI